MYNFWLQKGGGGGGGILWSNPSNEGTSSLASISPPPFTIYCCMLVSLDDITLWGSKVKQLKPLVLLTGDVVVG